MLWVQCLLLKCKYWCGCYDCKEEGNLVLQSRVIGWSNGIWPAVLLWFIASFLTLVLGFGILGFFQAQNLSFCHLRARFPSSFRGFFFFLVSFYWVHLPAGLKWWEEKGGAVWNSWHHHQWKVAMRSSNNSWLVCMCLLKPLGLWYLLL